MQLARAEELNIPIAPMIDIVFLLIVFFVVTSNMQNEAVDRQIKLAKSYYVPPQGDQKQDPRTITVNVRRAKSDRRPPVLSILGRSVSLPTLEQQLRRAHAEFGNDIPVVLRIDGELLYKYVDQINEVIGEAQLYRVSHSSKASVEETNN